MQKLSELSDKEKFSEMPLEGSYRIVLDLKVAGSKNITLSSLEESIGAVGDLENLSIEKYATDYDLEVGDVVEIVEAVRCEKAVFADSHGNLTISDNPVAGAIEPVGSYEFSLPEGTVAEVNRKTSDDSVEILFTGSEVEIPELQKIAYLGILTLPSNVLAKYKR